MEIYIYMIACIMSGVVMMLGLFLNMKGRYDYNSTMRAVGLLIAAVGVVLLFVTCFMTISKMKDKIESLHCVHCQAELAAEDEKYCSNCKTEIGTEDCTCEKCNKEATEPNSTKDTILMWVITIINIIIIILSLFTTELRCHR